MQITAPELYCVTPDVGTRKAIFLKAICFPMREARSRTAYVCTIIPSKESTRNPRFPSVEAILGSQHPICSCYVRVNVTDLQRGETFIVFFQFTATLPTNDSLEASFPDLEWRGGILAMRLAIQRTVIDCSRAITRGRDEHIPMKFPSEIVFTATA
ncbi:uncharacterized protein F5147DRAFT_775835 [Suillus discolor]|uniref:Uncharacterized protein n=1 Tax=Suillus discolor TaxID=1912936 RepID=A0A9P7JRZ9_9AGAM|nr:uncharacterized protein F5147DRAFT_775835 [Suillus discolor]KAG2103709.1 hypothetical protein F5147DRAFT_775835 [Suillus discolor]